MRMFRLLIAACVGFAMAACVGAKPNEAPQITAQKLNGYGAGMAEVENTAPPAVVYIIEKDDPGATLAVIPGAQDNVTISSTNGQSVTDMLMLLQEQIKPLVVGRNMDGIDTGNVRFQSITVEKFLRYVADRYDLSVRYDAQSDIVSVDSTTERQVLLPPILDSQQGEIGAGYENAVKVKAEPDNLKQIIQGAAQNLGVEIVAFSETTGTLRFKGRPSKVRALCNLIEQEATERLKFVTLHIMILELTAKKEFQRDANLTWTPLISALGNGVFGTFKLAYPAGMAVDMNGNVSSAGDAAAGASLGITKTNKVDAFIRYLEQWADTEVVTSPAVVTANGVPVSFNSLQEIGYWEPGDLESTTNANISVQTRGKPTFKSDNVGLRLMLRPKIMKDTTNGEEAVELDISLETSGVYSVSSTQWASDPETEPTTLVKPLKASRVLSSRAMIRGNEMLLLAKLNSGEKSGTRSGIPGVMNSDSFMAEAITGKSDKRSDSKMFIVINAVLPKNGSGK